MDFKSQLRCPLQNLLVSTVLMDIHQTLKKAPL